MPVQTWMPHLPSLPHVSQPVIGISKRGELVFRSRSLTLITKRSLHLRPLTLWPPLRLRLLSFLYHYLSYPTSHRPGAIGRKKKVNNPSEPQAPPHARKLTIMADVEAAPAAHDQPHVTPADPLAVGILPTAKQSLKDLFVWKKRVVVSNEYGETTCEWHEPDKFVNPISLFAMLSAKGWLFFLCGLAAWTADAFDFHALSIQTKKLSDYYETSKTNISTAITLTLLLRSVGAAFFGLLGDKYGRKVRVHPFVRETHADNNYSGQWLQTCSFLESSRLRPSTARPSLSSSQSEACSVSSWVV